MLSVANTKYECMHKNVYTRETCIFVSFVIMYRSASSIMIYIYIYILHMYIPTIDNYWMNLDEFAMHFDSLQIAHHTNICATFILLRSVCERYNKFSLLSCRLFCHYYLIVLFFAINERFVFCYTRCDIGAMSPLIVVLAAAALSVTWYCIWFCNTVFRTERHLSDVSHSSHSVRNVSCRCSLYGAPAPSLALITGLSVQGRHPTV